MGGDNLKLTLKKQPQKYLDSVDANTRKKLYKALDKLSRWEGDIQSIKGHRNQYRFKIDHYRIIFEYVKGEVVITVIAIATRSNAYKKR